MFLVGASLFVAPVERGGDGQGFAGGRLYFEGRCEWQLGYEGGVGASRCDEGVEEERQCVCMCGCKGEEVRHRGDARSKTGARVRGARWERHGARGCAGVTGVEVVVWVVRTGCSWWGPLCL